MSTLTYYRSNIDKLTLPIWGSITGMMLPFWSPTGDLVCQLEAATRKESMSVFCCFLKSASFCVSQARRVRGPRAQPPHRCTSNSSWAIRPSRPGLRAQRCNDTRAVRPVTATECKARHRPRARLGPDRTQWQCLSRRNRTMSRGLFQRAKPL